MYVTVTSLKLRSYWGFFKLSWFGLKISLQAKGEKGFVKMRNTGFGKLHFTLSQWQTEEDLKRFARSGEHQKAMRESSKLATSITTYSYSSASFPNWTEARKILAEKGKALEFK
jgi:hypothetical protein